MQASSLSFSPTASATRPPMPASTSSKTRVFPRSPFAETAFSPRTKRASSPPDAVLARGRGASPGLAVKRSSAESRPLSRQSAGSESSAVVSSNRKRAFARARSFSSLATSFSRRLAACRRRDESPFARARYRARAASRSPWSSETRTSEPSSSRISWRGRTRPAGPRPPLPRGREPGERGLLVLVERSEDLLGQSLELLRVADEPSLREQVLVLPRAGGGLFDLLESFLELPFPLFSFLPPPP